MYRSCYTSSTFCKKTEALALSVSGLPRRMRSNICRGTVSLLNCYTFLAAKRLLTCFFCCSEHLIRGTVAAGRPASEDGDRSSDSGRSVSSCSLGRLPAPDVCSKRSCLVAQQQHHLFQILGSLDKLACIDHILTLHKVPAMQVQVPSWHIACVDQARRVARLF